MSLSSSLPIQSEAAARNGGGKPLRGGRSVDPGKGRPKIHKVNPGPKMAPRRMPRKHFGTHF